MESDKSHQGRRPLGDLTNVTLDPKERKRERERARNAALTEEQREEKNRKRREAYARNNRKAKKIEGDSVVSSNKGDIDPNDDWLHRNDMFTPNRFSSQLQGIVSVYIHYSGYIYQRCFLYSGYRIIFIYRLQYKIGVNNLADGNNAMSMDLMENITGPSEGILKFPMCFTSTFVIISCCL